jgi:hypothetical protein
MTETFNVKKIPPPRKKWILAHFPQKGWRTVLLEDSHAWRFHEYVTSLVDMPTHWQHIPKEPYD